MCSGSTLDPPPPAITVLRRDVTAPQKHDRTSVDTGLIWGREKESSEGRGEGSEVGGWSGCREGGAILDPSAAALDRGWRRRGTLSAPAPARGRTDKEGAGRHPGCVAEPLSSLWTGLRGGWSPRGLTPEHSIALP